MDLKSLSKAVKHFYVYNPWECECINMMMKFISSDWGLFWGVSVLYILNMLYPDTKTKTITVNLQMYDFFEWEGGLSCSPLLEQLNDRKSGGKNITRNKNSELTVVR